MAVSTYSGIQLLRFLAAFGVLMTHVSFVIQDKFPSFNFPMWDLGLAGVAVFFVISGFVMVVSTQRLQHKSNAWREFASRRIIRIVPIYWLATTLKLAIVLMIPALAVHSQFDLLHTVASYFFIHIRDESGNFSPLHAVGWTLNYEMFFYFIFSLALSFHKNPIAFVSGILSGLIGVGLLFDVHTSASFVAYMQPIMLQFVIGMLIGYCCVNRKTAPYPLAIIMTLVGAYFVANNVPPVEYLGWQAFFEVGLPAALLVAGFAFLEPYIQVYIPRFLQELGDSSYSLYLFHPFILALTAIVVAKLGWYSSAWSIAIIMTLASVLGGWLIYKLVELPMTGFLRKFFSRKNS